MASSSSLLFATCLIICCIQLSVAIIGDPCVGGKCPNNEDGICRGVPPGICYCPDDKVASNDRTKCLTAATVLGSGCDEDLQCTRNLGLAICNTDRHQCSCQSDAIVVGTTCQKKKYLNEPCTSPQECSHVPHVSCDANNRICTCDPQYVPSPTNSTICLTLAVTWMSQCEESIQCQSFGDNAVCRDMKCGCKEGFHPGSSREPGLVSPVKTTCIKDKGLTFACERDECYLPRDGDNQNIVCIDKICKCKDDKMSSNDKQSCNGAGTMAVFSLFWAVVLAFTTSRA